MNRYRLIALRDLGGVLASHAVVRFGAFELDRHAGELRKDGFKVRLQEQPLQILCILLDKPGSVVTRDELRQRIWPSDTFVDFDHGINNAIKRLREALGDTAETTRFVQTLPRRGYRFIGKIGGESPRLRSLAVLPLVNLSGDPEQEYFAEGMTEALITTLAKIGQLRVISRTTSLLYKVAQKPIWEIAAELGVDTLIEGTVLRAGPRVRITAQLIDAQQEESHLWAESYERDLSNVFALQAEVAQDIARRVQVKLTPVERADLAQTPSVDPEAYEAYLKGRYHWNRRSRESLPKAIQYFQQAIAKDPAYTSAYAGLADALAITGLWGLVPPQEGCGKARGLALQVLNRDPSLSDGHISFGWVALHYDFAFADAEKEFERAIELNPRCTLAHHWFGMALGILGRFEEAFTESKRAIRLDPYMSLVHFGLAFVFWCGRHYDRAIEACGEALELDPYSPQAYVGLGLSYLAQSMHELSIAALEKGVELSRRTPVAVACLGQAYAVVERLDEAQQILDELLGHSHVTAYFVSRIYAALRMKKEAFEWLEIAYRERAEWLVLLKIDPCFDSLRDDQRFLELIRRMNYPELAKTIGVNSSQA